MRTEPRNAAEASEVELPAELEDPWIKGRSDLAEVTGAETVAHRIELSMVPDVKALRAKFESPGPIFTERETLEQGEIPVLPARAAQ